MPRCQRYSSWHPMTHNHFATWQSARQLVDATTSHGTHLLSATAVAGQGDGHPDHLLEMWDRSTSQPMAPPPATGALPPHINDPCYPGTTPVAAHRLRTGLGEGHDHSGVGPKPRGGMEIPTGNVVHQVTQPLPCWCWPNTAAPHRRPRPTRLNTAARKSRTGRQSNGPHSTDRKRTCSDMCTATSHKATKGTTTMYA